MEAAAQTRYSPELLRRLLEVLAVLVVPVRADQADQAVEAAELPVVLVPELVAKAAMAAPRRSSPRLEAVGAEVELAPTLRLSTMAVAAAQAQPRRSVVPRSLTPEVGVVAESPVLAVVARAAAVPVAQVLLELVLPERPTPEVGVGDHITAPRVLVEVGL